MKYMSLNVKESPDIILIVFNILFSVSTFGLPSADSIRFIVRVDTSAFLASSETVKPFFTLIS